MFWNRFIFIHSFRLILFIGSLCWELCRIFSKNSIICNIFCIILNLNTWLKIIDLMECSCPSSNKKATSMGSSILSTVSSGGILTSSPTRRRPKRSSSTIAKRTSISTQPTKLKRKRKSRRESRQKKKRKRLKRSRKESWKNPNSKNSQRLCNSLKCRVLKSKKKQKRGLQKSNRKRRITLPHQSETEGGQISTYGLRH